jgi:AraC-like DNA-binding protein
MNKVIFSSDELPGNLNDQSRFKLWHDMYTERYGDADILNIRDRPFSAHSTFASVGELGLARFEGTLDRFARTARQAAADARGDFLVGLGRRSLIAISQRGREAVLRPGGLSIYTNAEAYACRTDGENAWSGVCVPRQRLLDHVANADDLIGTSFDPSRPAIRHLRRYVEFLFASDEIGEDPVLAERTGEVLLDLVVLALGASGDAADIARGRGLRAARATEIAAEIKANFAYAAFSAHQVALKLGLSPRYVQALMQETGLGFTARVMELRLQKARAMLSDPRHDRLRISEIALACGFNEVSYFNRCFRRRFGETPTQYRGGGEK